MQAKRLFLLGAIVIAFCAAVPANATITINTSTATDWKISNGVVSLDWNSTTGNVFSVHLVGHPDDLVDTTTKNSNGRAAARQCNSHSQSNDKPEFDSHS